MSVSVHVCVGVCVSLEISHIKHQCIASYEKIDPELGTCILFLAWPLPVIGGHLGREYVTFTHLYCTQFSKAFWELGLGGFRLSAYRREVWV